MSTRETLIQAMGLSSDSETVRRMSETGIALADVDTMSQAIHDVYCGIQADHDHPNDKDRQQAQDLINALQKASAA